MKDIKVVAAIIRKGDKVFHKSALQARAFENRIGPAANASPMYFINQ